MAGLADQIPPELLAPGRKASVIEWIRGLDFPSRFKRRLLQHWGEYVKVEISAEDYATVVRPL